MCPNSFYRVEFDDLYKIASYSVFLSFEFKKENITATLASSVIKQKTLLVGIQSATIDKFIKPSSKKDLKIIANKLYTKSYNFLYNG